MVAYISMSFGNPYGDAWSEDELQRALKKLVNIGVRSISLADTVGMAGPDLIRRVVGTRAVVVLIPPLEGLADVPSRTMRWLEIFRQRASSQRFESVG